ncbi:hypothetical protein JW935_17135, partial [candidate division KSB1 bacterium]|nr:hypothetical protein [candidate division KSB1 bacterium]
ITKIRDFSIARFLSLLQEKIERIFIFLPGASRTSVVSICFLGIIYFEVKFLNTKKSIIYKNRNLRVRRAPRDYFVTGPAIT